MNTASVGYPQVNTPKSSMKFLAVPTDLLFIARGSAKLRFRRSYASPLRITTDLIGLVGIMGFCWKIAMFEFRSFFNKIGGERSDAEAAGQMQHDAGADIHSSTSIFGPGSTYSGGQSQFHIEREKQLR